MNPSHILTETSSEDPLAANDSGPQRGSRGGRGRYIYVAAAVLAALFLFALGGRTMLHALERSMIYFPAKVRGDGPALALEGGVRAEEVWLEAEDGVRIHGVRALTPAPEPLAELLFLHGNAGNLYDRLYNVEELAVRGINVLIIDYRGYGKSEGSPSEAGLYADARAAYRHLIEEAGVDPARLVVFGRSLGAAVAVELATSEKVGAVIAESAFTSVDAMARVHYGFLPGFILKNMKHEFDNLGKIEGLGAPVLFVHGDRDNIVPIELGRRLFEAAPEPKEWLEIPNAGHNDTVPVGGGRYFERIIDFVEAHLRAGEESRGPQREG